jgi:hypothetical protein
MSASRWMVLTLTTGLAVCGCKKLAELGGQAAEKATQASAEQTAAKTEPALIAGAAPGPAGFQWQRTDVSGAGSVEVPTGEGWTKEGTEVHSEKLGITAMVQVQPAVPPEARGQYLSSLVDVNKRDAPKYEVTAQAEGAVAQIVAGRVDGKFDNGTAYATRDYVLFAKGSAVAVMVRGPVAKVADVQAVADHMAVSFR